MVRRSFDVIAAETGEIETGAVNSGIQLLDRVNNKFGTFDIKILFRRHDQTTASISQYTR